MRRVRLHDYRIAGGKRGGGVSAGNAERQRKIAGAENCHRADGPKAGTQIGLGRLARGIGAVDARHRPRTFLNHFSEQPKLTRGASHFRFQTRLGQRRFLVRALDQGFGERIDVGRDLVQQGGASGARCAAELREGFDGLLRGGVHIRRGSGVIRRLQRRAGCRLESAKRLGCRRLCCEPIRLFPVNSI